MSVLIKNAVIVNEGLSFKGSLFIHNEQIVAVVKNGEAIPDIVGSIDQYEIIEADGYYLFPGIIDDQVHFREPGSTHKGDIASESRAAILGGVTSFMDMPNNNPPSITNVSLENKFDIAAANSFCNYSFYLGASNSNIDEIVNCNKSKICGIKVFMGSSTGNMLVDDQNALEKIFSSSGKLIATHCEEEKIIKTNLEKAKSQYGENIPFEMHPVIRSREACIASTKKAIDLALKYNSKLHVLHISTKEEVDMIKNAAEKNPQITGETCVHYLVLDSSFYTSLGSKMKCNPAIKELDDQKAIIDAVKNGVIKVIATDHAPHTKDEKNQGYLAAPSGLPLVQHSFQIMWSLVEKGVFDMTDIAKTMSHAPADVYGIDKRGYIRPGYYADFFIVDPTKKDLHSTTNPAYKCGWSPFEGTIFNCSIIHTFVNGTQVVKNSLITGSKNSKELKFKNE